MEDPRDPQTHRPGLSRPASPDSDSTFAAYVEEGSRTKAGSKQARSLRVAYTEEIPWSQRTSALQWTPFRGMLHDLKRRAPFYRSDWTLAFEKRNVYRVVASTLRMYALK